MTARSNRDAVTACSSLHETLLPTTATGFKADLAHLLEYQTFQGNFPITQSFWVGSSGSRCQAVDILGGVLTVPCSLSLPALCSQSSGFLAAPSASNQVTVRSNGLTLTG